MITPSPEQQAIIDFRDGPAAVLASPGSGKTYSCIERVSDMIKDGFRESEILCLTFTNAAAKEMKERAEEKLGREIESTFSTFHSLCARFLRKRGDQIFPEQLNQRYSIMDDGDQRRVVKAGAKFHNVSSKFMQIKEIMGAIGHFRTHGRFPLQLTPQKIKACTNIYSYYGDHKKSHNLLDFDDLIYYGQKLVKAEPIYSQIYRYVMVDEFQDSDAKNLDIALNIARHRNILVVGD